MVELHINLAQIPDEQKSCLAAATFRFIRELMEDPEMCRKLEARVAANARAEAVK